MLEMRLPHTLSAIRGQLKAHSNPYRNVVSAKRTFADMWQVQMAGIASLCAFGYFNAANARLGLVSRTDKKLPDGLEKRVQLFLE
jgi:hypothetical protein